MTSPMAEEPRRLLLFECARPGAVSLGSVVVSLSSFPSAPHSRRLTAAAAAAAGGAWLFEAEWRRGEGRRGGGAAAAGGGAVCPGTERPRPWRTPISSSTSSSATQVLVNHAYCYSLQTRGFSQCMTLLLVLSLVLE